MTNERRVLVHPDKAALAGSVAARFITKIIDVLDAAGRGVTSASPAARWAPRCSRRSTARPARDSVDWSRITFWWGDERYLPHGDPDRNDTQSRAALLDHLTLDASQIKSLSGPRRAARHRRRGARLRGRSSPPPPPTARRYPRFDITFLGVGPDGHVASLFPEHAHVHETERVVVAETDSPKPPPERLSLTLPVINSSDRIWLVLAGADKAGALGLTLAGASSNDVPAAGVEGRKRTVFFVDQEAAGEVPENLIAPSNYWTADDE